MVKLKINQRLFGRELTPTVMATKKFLDKAPADELFSGEALAAKINFSETAVRYRRVFDHPLLKGYSAKTSSNRYWGNPKAISEFVRQSKP